MAIFSRRILQRLINENARILSRNQIKKHVRDLNAMHKTTTLTLAPEWEVVLLNAFSKMGRIIHEKDIAGTSDLYFESHHDPKQNFLADITAVSDKGFASFDALDSDLRRRVEECGFNPSHFRLDVQGNHPEIQRGHYYMERGDESNTLLYGGAVKAELHMPGAARFEEKIFNADWDKFLDEIRGSSRQRIYRVYKPQERINLTISFNPGQRFGSTSHLAHQQINHLTENRIYEALRDKADQLAKANFAGPLGIIVCDGGYSPFHATPHFSTHPVRDVISYFLKTNPLISFVVTFVIKRASDYRVPIEIIMKIYLNESMSEEDRAILDHIEKACGFLPPPESDAFNALNHLKGGNPQEGRKNGELVMSSNEIRMSARTLMDLLSGRMTHEEFMSRHDDIPSGYRAPGYTNFFDMRLKEGKLISNISIEKSDTKDDDVISIRLRGPDPAISPFVVPP
jgi:hypothetical protein